MTDLSARLRTHGLTLSDFRRWIGKSQRQVEAWSRGENPTPQYVLVLLDLMDLLAEARPGWGPPGSRRPQFKVDASESNRLQGGQDGGNRTPNLHRWPSSR